MTISYNPPAFPVSWPAPNAPEPGMSLRDYFAGQALPAIILAAGAGQHMPIMRAGETHIVQAIARDAYAMADAMLAARGDA